MNLHEFQSKQLFEKFGIPVPRGIAAASAEAAEVAARELGGDLWVVKAQVHAGGRGKGGGVKLVKSPAEARDRVAGLGRTCRRVGGDLTLLIHNSSLYSSPRRRWYTDVLDSVAKVGS